MQTLGYYGDDVPAATSDEQATQQQAAADPLEQAEATEPEQASSDALFRRIIG
jgi:hypothetical protein